MRRKMMRMNIKTEENGEERENDKVEEKNEE